MVHLLGARVEEFVVPDGDFGLLGFAGPEEVCKSRALHRRDLRRLPREEEHIHAFPFSQIHVCLDPCILSLWDEGAQ